MYIDAAGRLTAGMGHLLPPSTSLHNGSPITQDQCDEWARADLQAACDAVNRHVSVPVNQNQFDALVSLVFNIGEP